MLKCLMVKVIKWLRKITEPLNLLLYYKTSISKKASVPILGGMEL